MTSRLVLLDDTKKAMKSSWIRSHLYLKRPLPVVQSSSLSSRTIASHYFYIFRFTIIMLVLLYIAIAVHYLSSTTSGSPSSSSKHENVHPMSQARQIPAIKATTRSTADSSNEHNNHDMSVTSSIVYQQLRSAGVSEQRLQQMQSNLPKWDDIVQQFGAKPIIHNLDSCPIYQALVPAQNRVLGAAGMFNTGTNLVTQLLKQNCYIPQRAKLYGTDATKEQLGIRWQVPWGKHTPAHYKYRHAASDKAATIPAQDVLPIITIRHPYRWLQSMCHHPYTAKWDHYNQCPNVLIHRLNDASFNIDTESVNTSIYNPVTVQYGAGVETYASLPHLWNDWYNEYYHHAMHPGSNSNLKVRSGRDSSKINHNDNETTSYPLLIVRIEDLIFHTKETITSICHCAGGQLYNNHIFTYIVTSAKGDSPGHDTTTDLVTAYIKYGTPLLAGAGFESTDYSTTKTVLDNNLMNAFHYQHPT